MNNEQEHSSHLTTELLLDYLEQRLAPDKVRFVEEHLATDCVACGSELAWLQETTKMMASADFWVDPPLQMRASVRQLYRDHHQKKQQSFSIAAWWRSLFNAPRPVAIAFAAAIAIIVVGALIFQFWFNQLESQDARVAVVQGTVESTSAGSTEARPVTEDSVVASGDLVKTDEGSSVVLTYPDESMTLVGANTEIALLELSSDSEGTTQVVVIHQEIGLTHNVVQPFTNSQSKFEIQTPAATINVRGTEFTVEVDSAGVTEVNVSEGTVEVEGQGKTIVLTTGEGTTVTPGSEPTSAVPVPTVTRPAGLATPLSSRSKTDVDEPLNSGGNNATATRTNDRSSNTPTATSRATNSSTRIPSPTSSTSDDPPLTSTATPSKTRESPTPSITPSNEDEPTATPTETATTTPTDTPTITPSPTVPPPTNTPVPPPPDPTDTPEPPPPPTDTPEPTSPPPDPTDTPEPYPPPSQDPPPPEPPTPEPPTPEPPAQEPPTQEPPTQEPPPAEPPPPDPYPPPS